MKIFINLTLATLLLTSQVSQSEALQLGEARYHPHSYVMISQSKGHKKHKKAKKSKKSKDSTLIQSESDKKADDQAIANPQETIDNSSIQDMFAFSEAIADGKSATQTIEEEKSALQKLQEQTERENQERLKELMQKT